jgi:hypothetical protein
MPGAGLLQGFRGSSPADVDALAQVVASLSTLVAGNPRILEIDLNPVIVHDAGAGVSVVDAMVVVD